jgi:ribosomal protein L29
VSEPGLSGAERARQLSWALLARLAMLRGAAASLPGTFPSEVETEYRRLREEFERLRVQTEAGALDQDAHERFRERARTLLRVLGVG